MVFYIKQISSWCVTDAFFGTKFQAIKVLAGLKHEKRCNLAATDIQKHYRGWQVSKRNNLQDLFYYIYSKNRVVVRFGVLGIRRLYYCKV